MTGSKGGKLLMRNEKSRAFPFEPDGILVLYFFASFASLR